MLAFSPPLFPTLGWPLEDPISHAQNYIYGETETSESFLHLPSSQPQVELNCSTPYAAVSGNPTMVKKLNHNVSERDRRKKINSLYSSLRSLLPSADQAKKLSIPSTVSRVLKYIPELQRQVERLIQKKEEFLSKISREGDLIHLENQRNGALGSSLSAVSARRLNDREIVVQISTFKVHESPLSEVLLNLEEDGLLVINASSFESFGGRVFYNLHLQVEGTQGMECELLSEKLLSLCERREAFP
ncbi:transcription factor ORG2-like isoform X1 [Vitis riparia]|uniref:transcription factor ORG2-like isoform X1 n=1 Tax=Vitis riparia TaxID=96939 RepID=UPI00155A8FCC|nr:transcription factor ORG2-like isoform X1 [Vitis riparia]